MPVGLERNILPCDDNSSKLNIFITQSCTTSRVSSTGRALEKLPPLKGLTSPPNIFLIVTRYEKKGQLTEKHILQDRRKCFPAHTKALFALLRLITTNPSKSLQA